jgi:hypothetical protein
MKRDVLLAYDLVTSKDNWFTSEINRPKNWDYSVREISGKETYNCYGIQHKQDQYL